MFFVIYTPRGNRYGSYWHAKLTSGRSENMSMVRVRLSEDGSIVRVFPDGRTELVAPQVDRAKLEATTGADIARQEAEDEVASASEVSMTFDMPASS
jgi:hypothetical protein